jgi:hypothetical protein
MSILTDFRQSLFKNPEPLKANDKYKENKHSLGAHIPYDETKHWVIYDFVNDKIYRKEMTPELLKKDTPENKFKNEEGEVIDFEMKDHIQKFSSGVMIEYQIPDGNWVLCLFDDKIYSLEDEDTLFYNTLHTTIQKKIYKKTKEDIAKIEYNLEKEFHWLWFRLDSGKLSKKIITRACSWIRMNPDFNFNLWTNMKSEKEVKDFFSDVEDMEEYQTLFKDKVKVHLFDELWELTLEFCEGLKNINGVPMWSNLIDIVNNVQDRASMIFKTDVVRCIILYMKGGWYADFNDTYCFVSLKYIIHPEKGDFIYMGSDYNHRHNNNYIMYSPKKHEVWLSNTLKLILFSFKIHRILELKEDVYANFVRCIFKTIASILEKKTEGCHIFEEIIKRLHNWITATNKETKEMLERCNIIIPIPLDMKMNEFILFIKYIMMREAPNSPMYKRFCEELNKVKGVGHLETSYRFTWKDDKPPEELYIPDARDIKFWKEHIISKTAIYNTLLQVNLKNMIYMTNMGSFFASENASKYVYSIPYCYVHENFCFISALGHIGDGTCTGNVKDYNHNYI